MSKDKSWQGKECYECGFWKQTWQFIGRCLCLGNEHYQHMIYKDHQACKNFYARETPDD